MLIGSDIVGHFAAYAETWGRSARVLDGLDEATREKVGRLNAERLWFAC